MPSKNLYNLTHAQRSIWFKEKMYPNTSIGIVAGTLRFKGKVDYSLLEMAINLVIEKNEGLRLRIAEENGVPIQYVEDYIYSKLDFYDFSKSNIEDFYRWEEQETKKPFQIINSQLFYIALVKVSDVDGGLYLKTHHLISDAWSMSIIGNQINTYYSALKYGRDIPETNNPSYLDYLQSEKEYENSERYQKDKSYWNDKFSQLPPVTSLKPQLQHCMTANSRRKTLVIPKKLTMKIREYCANNRVSIYVLFLAALSMYINRVTGNDNISLGTITLNRSTAKEKETVGVFANMLPIVINVDSEIDFNAFVTDITKEAMLLLKHQKYPYDTLLKELRARHKISENLFNMVLTYQNSRFNNNEHEERYATRWHSWEHQSNDLMIHVNDRDNEGNLIVDYDYLIDIFCAKEIEFIHQHIINLLWHGLDDPSKKISKLNMLSEKEKYKILFGFNETKLEYSHYDFKIPGEEVKSIPQEAKAYILDKNFNLLPIGVGGSLYLSDISEDQQKIFTRSFENPFKPNKKIYETGIYARWFPNGGIEYLGKAEDFLKSKTKINGTKSVEFPVNIASTFTSVTIGNYIEWWGNEFGIKLKIQFAGYNQVFQELINAGGLLKNNKTGINVVLIRFEDYIRDNNDTEEAKILLLEKLYKELIGAIREFDDTIPLITAVFPVSTHLGLSYTIQRKLLQLNSHFEEDVSNFKNVYLCNFSGLSELYSIDNTFDSIKDKEGHMPFTDEFYAAMGTEIARKIIAIKKQRYKVIVLDCDNTLWKGICGEQGALGVKIEGDYRQLQEFLIQKYNEGILLTICSKNNDKDVIDVFDNNPQMLLNKKHIVDWKINWNEKSENIREIADELSLGLESFIFIDDNPIECAKMVHAHPEVLTLLLPSEEQNISLFLKHIWAFDIAKITNEDAQRNNMYFAEQKRKNIKIETNSINGFLEKLNLRVSMREITTDEIERAAQLTQRTNQFNLSTIRRTEKEIAELANDKNYSCYVVEASDRYGDYGLVGLIILIHKDGRIVLDTLLLSCRILGRRVENVLLAGIKKYAKMMGINEIEVQYVPSKKNKPIYDFLENIRNDADDKTIGNYVYLLNVDKFPDSIQYISFYYNEKYPENKTKQDYENIYVLDHIAIAAKNIKETEKYYESLGYNITNSVYDPLQNSNLSICESKHYLPIEIVAPVNEKSPSYNIVEMRGEMPYHLCYKVSSIKDFLYKLNSIDYELVSEERPALLFNNNNVAFIMVKKVGLIELVEVKNNCKSLKNKFINNTIKMVVKDLNKAMAFFRILGYVQIKSYKDAVCDSLVSVLSGFSGEIIELIRPLNRVSKEYDYLRKNGAGIFQIKYEIKGNQIKSVNSTHKKYNIFVNINERKKEEKIKPTCSYQVLDGINNHEYLLPIQYCSGNRLLQIPVMKNNSAILTKYEAPRNETEEKIALIWKQIFSVDRIGIDDNFFELGGDSLSTVQLMSSLYKYNLEVKMQDIYKYPTIRELSNTVIKSENINCSDTNPNGQIYNLDYVHTKLQEIPLSDSILSGDLPPIDSAALAYIPDDFITLMGIDNFRLISSNLDSFFYNYIDTGKGNIGVIMLPILGKELYNVKDKLIKLSAKAIQTVGRLGAKVVSLTGLIPSVTQYGTEIAAYCKNNKINVDITTGHTTTSASVILSIRRLLTESRRNIVKEKVCVLGLGSIGATTIKLLLSVLDHPYSITLCDIIEKSEQALKLKQEIIENYNYCGGVNIAFSSGFDLPKEVYQSTLFIGATNVPDILDVDRLMPGALIVDDSGPHCFSKTNAISRLTKKCDILFTEGGTLKAPYHYIKKVYLPPFIDHSVMGKYQQHFFSSDEITGCILSSLLSVKYESLKPVCGKVIISDCKAHYEKLTDMNFEGANLHCDDFVIPESDIIKFRMDYGITA